MTASFTLDLAKKRKKIVINFVVNADKSIGPIIFAVSNNYCILSGPSTQALYSKVCMLFYFYNIHDLDLNLLEMSQSRLLLLLLL